VTAEEGAVRVEDLPGGIRVVTLDRPASRNALTPVLLSGLDRALRPEPSVRALVLEGEGTAFSSGYDLACLEADAAAGRAPDERIQEVLRLLEEHPAPSIAVVQGAAFGAGCELACAADLRVAGPDAVFCLPPLKLGIIYAPDGLWRLARLVGWQRAREMVLTGRTVNAEQAQGWGLADRLELDPVAAGRVLAEELARAAPLAVAGTRVLFRRLGRAPLTEAERAELELLRARAFASADGAEGRAAARERLRPRFQGR